MPRSLAACPCCQNTAAKLFSPDSPSAQLIKEQQLRLRGWDSRCDDLKLQLNVAFARQIAARGALRAAKGAEVRVRTASFRCTHLAATLREVRAAAEGRRTALARRTAALRAARRGVLRRLAGAAEDAAVDVERCSRGYVMAAAGLEARLAREVDMVHRALPVRVSGVAKSTRQPMQVSIANLRLPESPPAASAAMAAAALPTSAALAYLLQHLDLFAALFRAPLLHEAAPLGLESRLWLPATFWHRGPAVGAQRLRLSGLPREGAPSLGHAAASFMATAPSMLLASASAALDPAAEQGRRDAALQTALRVLLRSAACASQHMLARRLRPPPPHHWSPLAWLALCHEAALGRGELASMAGSGAVGAPPGVGPREAAARAKRGAMLPLHACFVDNDALGDEWDLVQTPGEVLPPPPSEVADTEHWERAMFTDRQLIGPGTPGRRLSQRVSLWVPFRPRTPM